MRFVDCVGLAVVLGGVLVGCGAGCAGVSGGVGGEGGVGVVSAEGSASVDAALREMAAPLVEHEDVVGMVVGVVLPGGAVRAVALGEVERGSGEAVGLGTVFEIGSVTKTMTALVVAVGEGRGELSLGDAVVGYAPAGVGGWADGVEGVTFEMCLRHTSGLARMPGNMGFAAFGAQPYAGYGEEALWLSLGEVGPVWGPGERYGYSNLGSALVGRAAARAGGASYEVLLRERVLDELGMGATVIAVAGVGGEGEAVPHGADLRSVEAWEFGAMLPAGGVRSTVGDMLGYVGACLEPGRVGGELGAAMERVVGVEGFAAGEGLDVLLGWHRWNETAWGGRAVWHNGGTAGSRSWVGFDPEAGVGAVVLANTASPLVDRLGMVVLGYAATGVVGDVGSRGGVALSEDVLRGYEGRYLMRGFGAMVVEADGGRLFAKIGVQPRFPLWAESETRFFRKGVESALEFDVDEETGRVVGVTLEMGGREIAGLRAGGGGGGE